MVADWVKACKKDRWIAKWPLFGQPALESLEPEDQVGFRGSVPARLGPPHAGHGPQSKLERFIDRKPLQCRVGSQLAVAADEADARLLDRHGISPVLGTRRHQVGTELAQVVTGFSRREIVEVQQRE